MRAVLLHQPCAETFRPAGQLRDSLEARLEVDHILHGACGHGRSSRGARLGRRLGLEEVQVALHGVALGLQQQHIQLAQCRHNLDLPGLCINIGTAHGCTQLHQQIPVEWRRRSFALTLSLGLQENIQDTSQAAARLEPRRYRRDEGDLRVYELGLFDEHRRAAEDTVHACVQRLILVLLAADMQIALVQTLQLGREQLLVGSERRQFFQLRLQLLRFLELTRKQQIQALHFRLEGAVGTFHPVQRRLVLT